MTRYAIAFLLAGVCLGCGGDPAPQPVRGTVTLDGKPMPDGKIYFKAPGKPPLIFSIASGAFEGKTLEGNYGVEIRAFRPGVRPKGLRDSVPIGDENYIPKRFNALSKLTAEVARSGANEFSFAVESK